MDKRETAKQIAERVPLPDPAFLGVSGGDLMRADGYTAAQMEAHSLAVAAEALRSCAVAFADTDPEARFIEDCVHLNCPACGGSGHIDDALRGAEAVVAPNVSEALAYSRNYATANPLLSKTAAEHILGLCDLLEKHASAPPAGSVDVTDARVERLARHMLGSMYPNSPKSEIDAGFRGAYRDAWLKKARAALTAALRM